MTYVPTTEEVKEAWLHWVDPNNVLTDVDSQNGTAEFDAWLQQVRREAINDAFEVYRAPDHDELDPEPWAVYCNGFPTFRRRATWAVPGDNGAGYYYVSVFEPRPEYSQTLNDYKGVTS